MARAEKPKEMAGKEREPGRGDPPAARGLVTLGVNGKSGKISCL